MGTINHFSHAHELTAVAPNASLRCSFCKRSKCTSMGAYACYTCHYFVGSICAMLKEQTNVPAHQQHPLTLLQPSATENASRSCRACGGRISGWGYSCSCNYDLHALCTLWPRTIASSCHQHPLYLDFPVGPQPRGGNGIGCNRCGHGDRGLWGYTCATCGYGFYHHLDCAAAIDPSEDPTDLLDRLLDVTETVVEVGRMVEVEPVVGVPRVVEPVVGVANNTLNRKQVSAAAPTTWNQTPCSAAAPTTWNQTPCSATAPATWNQTPIPSAPPIHVVHHKKSHGGRDCCACCCALCACALCCSIS